MPFENQFVWLPTLHGSDLDKSLRSALGAGTTQLEFELARARLLMALSRLVEGLSRPRLEVKALKSAIDVGLMELRVETTVNAQVRALRLYFVERGGPSGNILGLTLHLKSLGDAESQRVEQNQQIEKSIADLNMYLNGGQTNV